jgi:hypothetical protein
VTKRKLTAVVAAVLPLGLAAPGAAVADPAPAAASPAGTTMMFIPPQVGPLRVTIGPTIIGGKVIDPGLNVATPGTALAPIVWTMPLPSP